MMIYLFSFKQKRVFACHCHWQECCQSSIQLRADLRFKEATILIQRVKSSPSLGAPEVQETMPRANSLASDILTRVEPLQSTKFSSNRCQAGQLLSPFGPCVAERPSVFASAGLTKTRVADKNAREKGSNGEDGNGHDEVEVVWVNDDDFDRKLSANCKKPGGFFLENRKERHDKMYPAKDILLRDLQSGVDAFEGTVGKAGPRHSPQQKADQVTDKCTSRIFCAQRKKDGGKRKREKILTDPIVSLEPKNHEGAGRIYSSTAFRVIESSVERRKEYIELSDDSEDETEKCSEESNNVVSTQDVAREGAMGSDRVPLSFVDNRARFGSKKPIEYICLDDDDAESNMDEAAIDSRGDIASLVTEVDRSRDGLSPPGSNRDWNDLRQGEQAADDDDCSSSDGSSSFSTDDDDRLTDSGCIYIGSDSDDLSNRDNATGLPDTGFSGKKAEADSDSHGKHEQAFARDEQSLEKVKQSKEQSLEKVKQSEEQSFEKVKQSEEQSLEKVKQSESAAVRESSFVNDCEGQKVQATLLSGKGDAANKHFGGDASVGKSYECGAVLKPDAGTQKVLLDCAKQAETGSTRPGTLLQKFNISPCKVVLSPCYNEIVSRQMPVSAKRNLMDCFSDNGSAQMTEGDIFESSLLATNLESSNDSELSFSPEIEKVEDSDSETVSSDYKYANIPLKFAVERTGSNNNGNHCVRTIFTSQRKTISYSPDFFGKSQRDGSKNETLKQMKDLKACLASRPSTVPTEELRRKDEGTRNGSNLASKENGGKKVIANHYSNDRPLPGKRKFQFDNDTNLSDSLERLSREKKRLKKQGENLNSHCCDSSVEAVGSNAQHKRQFREFEDGKCLESRSERIEFDSRIRECVIKLERMNPFHILFSRKRIRSPRLFDETCSEESKERRVDGLAKRRRQATSLYCAQKESERHERIKQANETRKSEKIMQSFQKSLVYINKRVYHQNMLKTLLKWETWGDIKAIT